ncbi:MAG: hypothetical protein IJT68_03345 [Lentisphaeria bacterium]|nr:hypothetical protein [Lentisphaeria bacterium]
MNYVLRTKQYSLSHGKKQVVFPKKQKKKREKAILISFEESQSCKTAPPFKGNDPAESAQRKKITMSAGGESPKKIEKKLAK